MMRMTFAIRVAASTVAPVGGATAANVGVASADVAPTNVLWFLTQPPATNVAQSPAHTAARARAPNPTQGKPNFAAAAGGIPDAARVST
jgi:hypothetical protein